MNPAVLNPRTNEAVWLMVKPAMMNGKRGARGLILGLIAALSFLAVAQAAGAQQVRQFAPIPRTELYEREFISDFFDALGSRPEDLSWVEDSATVRVLVDGGVLAERGDVEGAINSFSALPENISSAFPFLATMKEDLLVPVVLDPWYRQEEAREMLFTFYEEVWLPHPEYRDDYLSFKEDTMGRASRLSETTPAVWIMGHLADYGFIADRQLTQDDPYLFLWDLLTGVSFYAQRATFYGLQWDKYDENKYKIAVVARVGQLIHDAHDEAARLEMGRGFWGDLISSHKPFETQTHGVESTGEVHPPEETGPTSETGTAGTVVPPVERTAEEVDYADLFKAPGEVVQPAGERAARIKSLVDELERKVQAAETAPQTPSGEETVPPEVRVTPPVEQPPTEQPPTEQPPTEQPPDEFRYEPVPAEVPSEAASESQAPTELTPYAMARLTEIADKLAVDIGALAGELGRETIDLVVIYNDVNVSEETVSAAEERYVTKREEFLAGLAVWDRFNMEIYSPLTLKDFNDLIMADLRSPYEELKTKPTQWEGYKAFESHFEEALGQIEHGTRSRRDQTDVQAAEAAALTAFLGDYQDLIKEIEDLLSGAVTSAPAGQ